MQAQESFSWRKLFTWNLIQARGLLAVVTSWPHGWLYRLLHRLDPTPCGRPDEDPDAIQAVWLVD